MAIKYVLHDNVVPPGKEKTNAQHARVYHNTKLSMEQLYELISVRSSLSSADVKGVLDSFQFWMEVYLSSGSTVELDGLGHFYPTLKSKSYLNEKGERKVKVKVDTVGFRCAPRLKRKVRLSDLVETKEGVRKRTAPEKRKIAILNYVRENRHINSTRAMRLNGCTRMVALSDLKALTAAGNLTRAGSGRTSVYLQPTAENPG